MIDRAVSDLEEQLEAWNANQARRGGNSCSTLTWDTSCGCAAYADNGHQAG